MCNGTYNIERQTQRYLESEVFFFIVPVIILANISVTSSDSEIDFKTFTGQVKKPFVLCGLLHCNVL
jgi:hypothetical protein